MLESSSIRYAPLSPNYPPLSRRSIRIREGMTRDLSNSRPSASPVHCKPWLDAEQYPIELVYPYETPLRLKYGTDAVEFAEFDEESGVSMFAPGYFSFLMGYRFQTTPGTGLLVRPANDPRYQAVEGILEMDWYALPPFIVFPINAHSSLFGYSIQKGDVIALLYPIITAPISIERMSTSEIKFQELQAQRYRKEREGREEIQWTSDRGQIFSHLYKERSRRRRNTPSQ